MSKCAQQKGHANLGTNDPSCDAKFICQPIDCIQFLRVSQLFSQLFRCFFEAFLFLLSFAKISLTANDKEAP